MQTDAELLGSYLRDHSEAAFTELVRRHLDLVYSAALREIHGDASLAEDISQSVFAELARRAKDMSQHPALGGWLYTCVRRMTANVRRAEDRRQRREQEAHTMNELQAAESSDSDWRQIQPLLDDAMHELSEADREAVVFRFFEGRTLKDVGLALGLNENAARMRVERALEKLRRVLAKRGVTSTASGLTAALAFGAVLSAPSNLVAGVAAGALATASMTSTSLSLFNLVTMTKLQTGIIGALVIAGVATPLVMQHQAQVRLRTENQSLHQQVGLLTPFVAETERLSNLVAQATRSQPRSADPSDEMLRLRAEVTRLRGESQELARLKTGNAGKTEDAFVQSAREWKARADELKQRLGQMSEQQIPQLRLLTDEDWLEVAKHSKLDTETGFRRALGQLRSLARGKLAGPMSVALVQYTKANDGQLPGDILQLKPHFKSPVDEAILQQYQLLHTGKLSDLPPGQWLITEKAPLQEGFDATFRVGYDKFGVDQSGHLEEALGRFYETNPGQEPIAQSQLLPYVKLSH